MSETCIVCLGDLGESGSEPIHQKEQAIKADNSMDRDVGWGLSPSPEHNVKAGSELIAHLLPCGHNLHDECLRPWVERANSCPICRKSFNTVELVATVQGPPISSYPVEDRTQVADIDPSMLMEEFDDPSPCSICGDDDNEDMLMLCDGCDVACHTYCVDLEYIPIGHWFCEACENQRALDHMCPLRSPQRSHHSADRRTRGQQRRLRNQNQTSSSNWARVWQSVWDRLNIDLDFPYDDSHSVSQIGRSRREQTAERLEIREWQRRFQVAERQGGTNRFRDTASTLLDRHALRNKSEISEPESREEIRAWNALEKAREIQANAASAKRKHKSATASPSDREPAPQPERRLKRPRTRRTKDLGESSSDAAIEPSAVRRRPNALVVVSNSRPNADTSSGPGPSFLQSLLTEVEASAAPDETKGQTRPPPLSALTPSTEYSSPHPSSTGLSPTNSNHPSPRPLCTTPPPVSITRPGSPTPLTSKVEPIFPPPEFSPSRSPLLEVEQLSWRDSEVSGRTRSENQRWSRGQTSVASSPPRSGDSSPPRVSMPFSAKADLQKMVTAALKPHYKAKVVSKDQYTDINRNVSRLLYNQVGDIDTLDDDAKEGWEKFATEEVSKAVEALRLVEGA
ncbi:MAG: hypothetical protein M1830_004744 [Pleopsidium flavum]|nr:MAG: hypothetical protein M1830_004744 [Pleopsidium flavum]